MQASGSAVEYGACSNIMRIDSSQLLTMLEEYSLLSGNQRRVFLHCLVKLPRPVAYSSDIRSISMACGYHVRTVQKALRLISSLPTLGQCVKLTRINRKEALYVEHQDKQATQI